MKKKTKRSKSKVRAKKKGIIKKKVKQKKILIIDDEIDFNRMVKLNLEETGKYKVKTQSKGAEGLATARQFKPDLIFLDLAMPDMQGGEVARQLREDESVKNIPIVFLTALATKEETASRGAVIGGNLFVAKPVNLESLIECIEENT